MKNKNWQKYSTKDKTDKSIFGSTTKTEPHYYDAFKYYVLIKIFININDAFLNGSYIIDQFKDLWESNFCLTLINLNLLFDSYGI